MASLLPPLSSNAVAPEPSAATLEQGQLPVHRGSGTGEGSLRKGAHTKGGRTASIPCQQLADLAERRGGVVQQFAKMLRALDENGDGEVDANEMLNCVEKLMEEQKLRKQYLFFAVASLITTIITVGVICGLSIVIGERLKDTQVSGNVMTVKGSTDVVQVASSDMVVVNGTLMSRPQPANLTDPTAVPPKDPSPLVVATRLVQETNCPIYMTEDQLVHIQMFSVPLPSGAHMYLRAAGYVRVDYPKPSITILTHIGEIRITDDCTAMEGTGIDYLSQHGYMTLRNGRHLLSAGDGPVTRDAASKTTFTFTGYGAPAPPPPPKTISVGEYGH